MTTYKTLNHEVRCVDGKIMYLPPWVANQLGIENIGLPNIYEADAAQKYPIGTKLVVGDRSYRYAYAGGTLNPDLGAHCALEQCVAYTTIAEAAVAEATSIVLDVAVTDGPAGNGVIAVNYLAGGYIVIFDASGKAFTRMIRSNTAVATGEMTVVLDVGIPVALIANTDHCECMASPYANIQALTSTTTSVMGIPTVVATVGQWFWLQTWGPVWIAPQGSVSVGNNNRQVVFRHDGSVDDHDYSDANVVWGQHAGFVITNAAGGGQGAAFIMLQICP